MGIGVTKGVVGIRTSDRPFVALAKAGDAHRHQHWVIGKGNLPLREQVVLGGGGHVRYRRQRREGG